MRRPLQCIAFLLLCAAETSLAWDLSRGVVPDVPAEALSSFIQVMVVTPQTMNPGPHNHGIPPRGEFLVDELIRGNYVKTDRIELLWAAKRLTCHFVEWDESMPQDWRISYYKRPMKSGWEDIPLPPPPLGEKIIVFARRESKHDGKGNFPLYTVLGAFAYSDANIAALRRHMGRTDWPPSVLVSLLLVVFILAIVATGRLASSFVKDLALQRRRLKLGGILFGASFILWLALEYGNVTGGIRIDLLLLFPLFLLSIILLVASGVVLKCKQNNSITR